MTTTLDGGVDADNSLDHFEDGLSALFSQPIIAHSLPPSSLYLPFEHALLPGPSIQLRLPTPPANLTALQAHFLWPSGLHLSHRLLTREARLAPSGAVLELGAGAGLVGIVAGRLLEAKGAGGIIVGSDFGADGIVDVIRDNYARALPNAMERTTASSAIEPGGGMLGWAVTGHAWGSPTDSIYEVLPPWQRGRRFMTVLGSDLLFNRAGHRPLLVRVTHVGFVVRLLG
jgi:hypothetical protein